MLENTKEEKLKDILLHVLRVDSIVNRFHNKVQFMNLNFMMGRIDTWEEDRLEKILEAIEPVHEDLLKIQNIIDGMQDTVQTLIESYTYVTEPVAEDDLETTEL
jgi:archaellum component FlaC